MKLSPDTADTADPRDIAAYLDVLFDNVEWKDGAAIALRGLGEKGTPAEGVFREQDWATGASVAAVEEAAARWNAAGAGAFIVPAVMKPGAQNIGRQGRQTEADVEAFTSVCVDLDNPDTAEDSLARLEYALGVPGLVVDSSPGKIHAYWLLDEPTEDIELVARLRHLLALKAGGDPSFLRIPQVIRLPGTIHGKNGHSVPVRLRSADTMARHSLSDLAERIEEMAALPWASKEALAAASQGKLTLAAMADGSWTARERLTEQVHEGGTGVNTRWDAASQVFGHYIHAVRTGALADADEAKAKAHGWMLSSMVPPWPEERFEREWAAVVALDEGRNGPLVAPQRLYGSGQLGGGGGEGEGEATPGGRVAAGEADVMRWAINRWVPTADPPPRRWLVHGLVRAGASHVLASEGGVGKTFMLLDLALAVACPEQSPTWLGQPVVPDNCGGTAVVITAEDDAAELRIRIHSMDGRGRRFAAADRVLVIPLVEAGGVFPLVELGAGGIARPSAAWSSAIEVLAALPRLQLVAIDTMAATLHGEENSSIVIQQYLTALNLIRGRVPEVATVITHHVRKQGAKEAPIMTAADMRQAIRGSNALLGSVRMAMGVWQPGDWQERLKRMGRPAKPGTLFHLAVVKANNPEAMSDTRTLLRATHGGLEDATALDRETSREDEVLAWLVCAIERAVEAGHPYTKTGNSGLAGLRRGELPPALDGIGLKALAGLVDLLVARGRVVAPKVPGAIQGLLDVPGGPMAEPDPLSPYAIRPGAHTPDWSGYQFNRLSGTIVEIG